MLLELFRKTHTPTCVLGELLIDGIFHCYTIELPIGDGKRGWAIPEGMFPVRIGWSPLFKKQMIRVEPVPGRDGILIHKGNGVEDTSGCILVGKTLAGNRIVAGTSTLAYEPLYSQVKAAQSLNTKIFLRVSNQDLAIG